MRWTLAVVVVALGCGSHAPANPAPPPPPVDAALPPLAPECPPSYGDVPAGQACAPTPVQALSCAYAEGACTCAQAQPCTGVLITEDDVRALPVIWQCTPTPPAVRPDGCPGAEPSSGQVRCAKAGQVCSYQQCCTTDYTCADGVWNRSGGICPP